MAFKHSISCFDYKWGSFWCPSRLKTHPRVDRLSFWMLADATSCFLSTHKRSHIATASLKFCMARLCLKGFSFNVLYKRTYCWWCSRAMLFYRKMTSPSSDPIQKVILKKETHFALLISGGAAENKLMFIYHRLKFSHFKSLVSQMGGKWKYWI